MTNDTAPVVVFLGIDGAGRSEMAAGFFDDLAGDQAISWIGRSRPSIELNAAAAVVMAEVGIDIAAAKTRPVTEDLLRGAEVVVTMGYGASYFGLGTNFEDWQFDDPADGSVAALRPIRDEIERRVRTLLTSLNVCTAGDYGKDRAGR